MKKKTIGILGGMGPLATADLFEKIIAHTRAARDQEHLRVLIDSNTRIPDRTAAILQGGEDPAPELRSSARGLERQGAELLIMTGFLDGINDSLKEANPIEEMEEDTKVSLAFDKELLYKNMVAAGADWLYELPEWEEIFDEDKRKELYREQKLSMTVVKPDKVYPNDPCPCGSGKKYKKCCGKKG